MASEAVTAAELAPASLDLTYFGTFKNIVVVIASVEVANHEIEAATAAIGSAERSRQHQPPKYSMTSN